jgi:hypothetical protein
MHRISLHLAAPQRDMLLKLSVRTGLPVAELIRRAIDEFAARQALKKDKE